MQDPNGKDKRPSEDASKETFDRTEKSVERVDEWPAPPPDTEDDGGESGGDADDD